MGGFLAGEVWGKRLWMYYECVTLCNDLYTSVGFFASWREGNVELCVNKQIQSK